MDCLGEMNSQMGSHFNSNGRDAVLYIATFAVCPWHSGMHIGFPLTHKSDTRFGFH